MELMEFLEGIRLMPEAIEKVQNLSVSKTRYECVRQMFYEDKSRFYEEILKEQNYRIWFLYYYSRMASELYEVYQEKGIEETVFWIRFMISHYGVKTAIEIMGNTGFKSINGFRCI